MGRISVFLYAERGSNQAQSPGLPVPLTRKRNQDKFSALRDREKSIIVQRWSGSPRL